MTYTEWCRAHDCDHAHCPHDCEHPQPFVLDDGRLICGRCAILDRDVSVMMPCRPDICERMAAAVPVPDGEMG